MKNKNALLLLTTFLFLLLAPTVLADGGFIPPHYDQRVYIPEQKAAIIWDGETETIILSTKAKPDEILDMAWIIPVPSDTDPEVDEGDMEIFYDLAEIFRPRRQYTAKGFGAMSAESLPDTVEIIEAKTVDIYNIVILRATSAEDMVDWLNLHGFDIDESSISILQYYCDEEDFYFIANQINLGAKYADKATYEDKECAEFIYEELEYRLNYMSEYEIEQQVEWMIETYDECYYAAPGTVSDLVNLKTGISTPLEINITPEQPFYPMRISSINPGNTDIEVYVVSPKPVKDYYGVLEQEQMTTVPSYFKNNYHLTNQKYITYLTYDGPLSALHEDSVFVTIGYKAGQDPKKGDRFTFGTFLSFLITGRR